MEIGNAVHATVGNQLRVRDPNTSYDAQQLHGKSPLGGQNSHIGGVSSRKRTRDLEDDAVLNKRMSKAGSRVILDDLEKEDVLMKVSGGFQLFVRKLNDEEAKTISSWSKVKLRWDLSKNQSTETYVLLQALRHHYNTLTPRIKYVIELSARRLYINHNNQANAENKETIDSDNCELFGGDNNRGAPNMKTLADIGKNACRMPPSEFIFSSERGELEHVMRTFHQKNKPLCTMCVQNVEVLKVNKLVSCVVKDVTHLLCHPTAYLYACHCCGSAFNSRHKLMTHGCHEFSQYLMSTLGSAKITAKSSCMLIACAECGAYVRHQPNLAAESEDQKDMVIQFLCSHNTHSIVPIVIYFMVKEFDISTISLQYIPSFLREFHTDCDRCRIAFSSPEEAETHFCDQSLHAEREFYTCNCGTQFAIETNLKEHLLECSELSCPQPGTSSSQMDERCYLPSKTQSHHLLADWLSSSALLLSSAGVQLGTEGRPEKAFGGQSECLNEDPESEYVCSTETNTASRLANKKRRSALKQHQELEEEVVDLPLSPGKKPLSRETLRILDVDPTDGNGLVFDALTNFEDPLLCRSEELPDLTAPLTECNMNECYMQSIREQYQKTLTIDIDRSIVPLPVDGTDAVYICFRCSSFVQGSHKLVAHLNWCAPRGDNLDHDVDDRAMSFPVRPSSQFANIRFHCPECVQSVCSLAALKIHLATKHSMWTGGILDIDAPEDLPVVPVTTVVDQLLGMDELLENTVLSKSSGTRKEIPHTLRDLKQLNRNFNPGPHGPASVFNRLASNVVAKKSMEATNIWAESRRESMEDEASTIAGATTVMCSSDDIVASRNLRIRPPFRAHPSVEVVPPVVVQLHATASTSELSTSSSDAFPASPGLSETDGNSPKNLSAGKRLRVYKSQTMCPLCQTVMQSSPSSIVHNHMRRHKENLTTCYLCPTQERFPNFLAFLIHLSEKHIAIFPDARGHNVYLCTLCNHKLTQHDGAKHLLYSCKQWPVCLWCGDSLPNGQSYEDHLLKEHAGRFTYFLCTGCPFKACSLRQMVNHPCSSATSTVKRCQCNIPTLFENGDQFRRHFRAQHVFNDTCSFCDVPADGRHDIFQHMQSRTWPSEHRLTFPDGRRKIVVLDDMLVTDDVFYDHGDFISLTTYDELLQLQVNEDVASAEDSQVAHATDNYPDVPSVVCLDDLDDYQGNERDLMPPPAVSLTTSVPGKRKKDHENEKAAIDYGPASVVCLTDLQAANTMDEPLEADLAQSLPSVICLDLDVPIPGAQMEASVREERQTHTPVVESRFVDGEDNDDDDIVILGEIKASDKIDKEKQNKDNGIGSAECVTISVLPHAEEARVDTINEGDDECLMEAHVTHAPGFLSSSVQPHREKKFACNQCSEKFLTNARLKEHYLTHKADAGATTCEEEWGLPMWQGVSFYLCRLCSIAYSDKEIFLKHAKSHAKSHYYNCPLCVNVSFNKSTAHQHYCFHEKQTKERGGDVYLCVDCKLSFFRDDQLMVHAAVHHHMPMIFFCKKCSLAMYDPVMIIRHIEDGRCADNLAKEGVSFQTYPEKMVLSGKFAFGCAPANLFHYQPRDEKGWKQLQSSTIAHRCHDPCLCAHRSFLTTNNVMVMCLEKYCGTLITTNAWLGPNEGRRQELDDLLLLQAPRQTCMGWFEIARNESLAATRELRSQRTTDVLISSLQNVAQQCRPNPIAAVLRPQMPQITPFPISTTVSSAQLPQQGHQQTFASVAQSNATAQARAPLQTAHRTLTQPQQVDSLLSVPQSSAHQQVPVSGPTTASNVLVQVAHSQAQLAAMQQNQQQQEARVPPPFIRGPNGARIIPGRQQASSTVQNVPRLVNLLNTPSTSAHVPTSTCATSSSSATRVTQPVTSEASASSSAQQQRPGADASQLLIKRRDSPSLNRQILFPELNLPAEEFNSNEPLFDMMFCSSLSELLVHRCILCGHLGTPQESMVVPDDARTQLAQLLERDIRAFGMTQDQFVHFARKLTMRMRLQRGFSVICQGHFSSGNEWNRQFLVERVKKMMHVCVLCGRENNSENMVPIPSSQTLSHRREWLLKLYGNFNGRDQRGICYSILFSPFEQICISHLELASFCGGVRNANFVLATASPLLRGGLTGPDLLMSGIIDYIRAPLIQHVIRTMENQWTIAQRQRPTPRAPVRFQITSEAVQVAFRDNPAQRLQPAVPAVNRPPVQAAHVAVSAQQQMNMRNQAPLASVRNQALLACRVDPQPCQVCGTLMVNQSHQMLHHYMHNSNNRYFCSVCMRAFATERDMVHHVLIGHNRRSVVWELMCPVIGCNPGRFPGIYPMKKHLSAAHGAQLRSLSTCGARFATSTALAAHERLHDETQVDQCCLLCGTCDQWSLEVDGVVLRHIMAHSIPQFLLCAVCGFKGRGTNPEQALRHHFAQAHSIRVGQKVNCTACSTEFNESDGFYRHMDRHHRMIVFYDAQPNAPGPLRIQSGRMMCQYLGIVYEEKARSLGRATERDELLDQPL